MCWMFLGFPTPSRMWNLIIYWSLIYSGLYNFWFASCLLCRIQSMHFLSIWILKLLDLRSQSIGVYSSQNVFFISLLSENILDIPMWIIKILFVICPYFEHAHLGLIFLALCIFKHQMKRIEVITNLSWWSIILIYLSFNWLISWSVLFLP